MKGTNKGGFWPLWLIDGWAEGIGLAWRREREGRGEEEGEEDEGEEEEDEEGEEENLRILIKGKVMRSLILIFSPKDSTTLIPYYTFGD